MPSISIQPSERPATKWRTFRRRTGSVLLVVASLSSLLGLLTAPTFGSALMVLGFLIVCGAMAVCSTKRRLVLSLPSLTLGVLGLVIIIGANT